MALYFLVLERAAFHVDIHPALSSSWRQRSFGPCLSLCTQVLPTALEFCARYHVAEKPLLAQFKSSMSFDRALWQHLAGELLWFSAVEIPELETYAETLACLLAPVAQLDVPRPALPPILQAHWGSRDLSFGGGYYRPEYAGWNDVDDVARLAAYLTEVRPETWCADDLAAVPDLPPDEREEEFAYLRDWFPALRALYVEAAKLGRIIVCETLE